MPAGLFAAMLLMYNLLCTAAQAGKSCSCAQFTDSRAGGIERVADCRLDVAALMLLKSAGVACQVES